MIYKYYVFELCRVDGGDLITPSMTCKFYRWWNPIRCLQAARNQLHKDDLPSHRVKRFYRIN